jgi:hypothetical protein
MRIEVLARLPTLHHDIEIGIVDADVALIGKASLLLPCLGNAFLVALDERFPALRLHLRGGNNVNHDLLPVLFVGDRADLRT